MAQDTSQSFSFTIRGREREVPETDKAIATEKRDQQLEQYLWAPYNHVCLSYDTTDQTFAGAAITALTYNSDEHDPESMHSKTSNTSRITCFVDGIWRFNFSVFMEATNAAHAYFRLRKNGTTLYPGEGGLFGAGDTFEGSASRLVYMAVDDYMEVVVDRSDTIVVKSATDPKQRAVFQAEFVTYVKESGLQTD